MKARGKYIQWDLNKFSASNAKSLKAAGQNVILRSDNEGVTVRNKHNGEVYYLGIQKEIRWL